MALKVVFLLWSVLSSEILLRAVNMIVLEDLTSGFGFSKNSLAGLKLPSRLLKCFLVFDFEYFVFEM